MSGRKGGQFTGQLDHVRNQTFFAGSATQLMPLGRTMLSQNLTDTTLRHFDPAAYVIDAGATTGGAQKFPRVASVKISLSSVRSDTAFLSRSFSF